MENRKIRVTVWKEFRHEKSNEYVKSIYPNGRHAVLAEALEECGDIETTLAALDDPDQGLPQWIELKLDCQQPINTIHVTLDTDMTNPAMLRPFEDFPNTLVKAYTVEVNDGQKWITVGSVEDNWMRRIDHKFDTINATAVRINVTESGDGVTARVFEVRIYNE
jgi:hypothetical protein